MPVLEVYMLHSLISILHWYDGWTRENTKSAIERSVEIFRGDPPHHSLSSFDFYKASLIAASIGIMAITECEPLNA